MEASRPYRRTRDPKARIVIVPDAGKEGDAQLISQAVVGEFVEMPKGSPSNYDCNDLARDRGSAMGLVSAPTPVVDPP